MLKGFGPDATGGALASLLAGPVAAVALAPNSGAGDDTYTVDSPDDIVFENPNEGTDTVISFITYQLPDNVENLILSGDGVLGGRGNALNNTLISNMAVNYLYGGPGDDTYFIQNAGDMVEEAHYEGTDTIYSTVSYSLFGRAVENFYMLGEEHLVVWGNSLNNLLVGNSGSNVINGEAGADTMWGGQGDDTYIVNAASDVVMELAGEGYDLLQSFARAYTLPDHFENISLLESSNAREITGNSGINILIGNSYANKLTGGLGNDTYYIQNSDDNVVEAAGGGDDWINSTVSYDLKGRHVETLWLMGTDNINATGNSLADNLHGNDANNVLTGLAGKDVLVGHGGADTLIGGASNDALTGGSGADLFLFQAGSAKDQITDFSALENDSIDISAYTSGAANAGLVTQSGDHVLINLGGGNVITVSWAVRADVLAHIVW